MEFACTHYVSSPAEAVGQHVERFDVAPDDGVLLLVNVYGLLLPEEHPARQALVSVYGADEVCFRESLARAHLLPVMHAARGAGIPVVYVADSAPNIGLEGTHIRAVMMRHLAVDPLAAYTERGNDPLEYCASPDDTLAYAPELAPQEGDFYVRKWVYSGFHATWLDRLLRNLRTEVLFCAGFNGDSDLFCTMLEGQWAGYRVVLLRDCHAGVHVPSAEPEMAFSERLEMYAEASLGFTLAPEDFCAACGDPPLKNRIRPAESIAAAQPVPTSAVPEGTSPVIPDGDAGADPSRLTFAGRYFRRYPAGSMLGYAAEAISLDPARTAFLAVDVYGETPTPMLVARIAPALQAARDAGLPVIYAGNSAPKVDLDHYEFTVQRNRNARHYFPVVSAELTVDPREYHHGDGPWGRYLDCVAPQPSDIYVRKIAYSGFYETRLDSVLRHLGIETLVAVGFSASECLLGTLIEAFNRNYRVILLRDCTRGGAMTDLERRTDSFTQRMTLWMETYLGASSTSDAFIAACEALRR